MKLDFDLIKKIMKHVEEEADGNDSVWVSAEHIGNEYTQKQIDYHLLILGDDNLIDIQTQLSGVAGTIAINRLTAEGHRVLEAMSSTAWEKIKNKVIDLGNEGLKQIPSLFIKLVLMGE